MLTRLWMTPLREDAVAQVNARIALETGNWTLALVGKNLTDEDTYSYITETPLSASCDQRPVLGAGYAAYTGYQEPPRTYRRYKCTLSLLKST